MERDRRGGLRVFPGPALQRTATGMSPAPDTAPPSSIVEIQAQDVTDLADESVHPALRAEAVDVVENDPEHPVDTTAELLGRAKPKRPRSRAAAPAAGRKTTRSAAGARKPATRRAPRGRKAGTSNDTDQ